MFGLVRKETKAYRCGAGRIEHAVLKPQLTTRDGICNVVFGLQVQDVVVGALNGMLELIAGSSEMHFHGLVAIGWGSTQAPDPVLACQDHGLHGGLHKAGRERCRCSTKRTTLFQVRAIFSSELSEVGQGECHVANGSPGHCAKNVQGSL